MNYKEAYRRAVFTDEHWNNTCRATIPAAWDIYDRRGYNIASGSTRQEAAEIASTR